MPPHEQNRHNQHDPINGGAPPLPKPTQQFLYLILKVIIMTMITTFFFLFLGVAAILFLIATAALHRHYSPSSNPSNGLSVKDLKKLPRFRFARKTKPETEISCVVCLEGIKQGQWCRNLVGCGHLFHKKCVDPWLVKVSACPICRTQIRLDHVVKDRPFWEFDWRNGLGFS